jgi:hypothetical protein
VAVNHLSGLFLPLGVPLLCSILFRSRDFTIQYIGNLQLVSVYDSQLPGVFPKLNHCGFDYMVVTHRASCQCRKNVGCRCGLLCDGVEQSLKAGADSVCTIAATSNLLLGEK